MQCDACRCLLKAIRDGRRASFDSLVVEVPLNVSSQLVGRLGASLAIFLQSFHHDPVEFAAQDVPQCPWIAASALRNCRLRRGVERIEQRAGAARFVFADHPPHLGTEVCDHLLLLAIDPAGKDPRCAEFLFKSVQAKGVSIALKQSRSVNLNCVRLDHPTSRNRFPSAHRCLGRNDTDAS